MTEEELQQRAKKIKLLLLDVDGVLTDGKLYFGNNGEELKAFNIMDGLGMKMLQEHGVQVGIVTGRESKLVAKRASDLDIKILHQACKNKKQTVQEIAQHLGLELEQLAFMGDDYIDLGAMSCVGLALTTANAHSVNISRAHWCSEKPGGSGAVREACDMIMQAQDTFTSALAKYL